jgi:hypothetical protein
MNTYTDKTQENKSQAVANSSPKLQSNGESSFQFVDNRPEAIAQRKLQEVINNSPQVKQLRDCQAMANSFTVQRKENIEEETLQGKFEPIQRKENKTGLPDNLKTGMENLSGISLDDVKVHRNSDKPAQLQAHAYAQGTDIHLGPGQEKHLPHEAWHVVQQKQGRVKPTLQMKGNVNINDDTSLENEADVMGAKAFQFVDNRHEAVAQRKLQEMANNSPQAKQANQLPAIANRYSAPPIQRVISFEYDDRTGDELKINRVVSVHHLFTYLTTMHGFGPTSGLLEELYRFDQKNAIFSDTAELIELLKPNYDSFIYQSNNYWYNPISKNYFFGPEDSLIVDLKPIEAPDRIYLVGEGDFSFALSITKRWQGQPVVIMATSYETEEDVMERPAARKNILALKDLGVRLQFQVDATRLHEEPVSPRQVDKIGFVFPHAGGGGGDAEAKRQYVLLNEPLLKNFLATSLVKLADGGAAFIVMKETEPYSILTQKFSEYASEFGYSSVEKRGFAGPNDYKHVYTGRSKAVKGDEHASLFIFRK